ncbi:hypothetical protein CLF_103476, partial [Clonorchis sinensis]
ERIVKRLTTLVHNYFNGRKRPKERTIQPVRFIHNNSKPCIRSAYERIGRLIHRLACLPSASTTNHQTVLKKDDLSPYQRANIPLAVVWFAEVDIALCQSMEHLCTFRHQERGQLSSLLPYSVWTHQSGQNDDRPNESDVNEDSSNSAYQAPSSANSCLLTVVSHSSLITKRLGLWKRTYYADWMYKVNIFRLVLYYAGMAANLFLTMTAAHCNFSYVIPKVLLITQSFVDSLLSFANHLFCVDEEAATNGTTFADYYLWKDRIHRKRDRNRILQYTIANVMERERQEHTDSAQMRKQGLVPKTVVVIPLLLLEKSRNNSFVSATDVLMTTTPSTSTSGHIPQRLQSCTEKS